MADDQPTGDAPLESPQPAQPVPAAPQAAEAPVAAPDDGHAVTRTDMPASTVPNQGTNLEQPTPPTPVQVAGTPVTVRLVGSEVFPGDSFDPSITGVPPISTFPTPIPAAALEPVKQAAADAGVTLWIES